MNMVNQKQNKQKIKIANQIAEHKKQKEKQKPDQQERPIS